MLDAGSPESANRESGRNLARFRLIQVRCRLTVHIVCHFRSSPSWVLGPRPFLFGFTMHVSGDTQDMWKTLPDCITVGTACSGTDIVIGILRELANWWSPFGFQGRFHHKFSCDVKAAAKSFITACWSPEVREYTFDLV